MALSEEVNSFFVSTELFFHNLNRRNLFKAFCCQLPLLDCWTGNFDIKLALTRMGFYSPRLSSAAALPLVLLDPWAASIRASQQALGL